MTVKAFLHSRNPCILGSVYERMTEPAADLLHPCMDAVTEVDRLLRADPLAGINIIEIEHDDEQKGRCC